jgi:hypothetical protein
MKLSRGLRLKSTEIEVGRRKYNFTKVYSKVKVGCLHPVACTRSGSGFPSNATLILNILLLNLLYYIL